MTAVDEYARESARSLRERMRRNKLLFVQAGAIFDGVTSALIQETRAHVVDVAELKVDLDATQVIVTGMEVLTSSTPTNRTLGDLRRIVAELLDRGTEVCLWSRAPRVAFRPVPGSSLIEDASPFFLSLMREEGSPESVYPVVRVSSTPIHDVFVGTLAELGLAVLGSLDRAVFDGQLSHDSMFDLLDPRECESLRGGGLAHCENGGSYVFASPLRFGEFKSALADVLAAEVNPQPELANIADDLWCIERTLRRELRTAAVHNFGGKWRAHVLHGDLALKVKDRAMADGSVAIQSARELRDPIEWLTLGELLEVITSTKFNGLGLLPLVWTKFGQDILPIRNRLSHMRHFRHGDRATVKMWLAQINRLIT